MTIFLMCDRLDELGGVQRVVRTLSDGFMRDGAHVELISIGAAAEPHRMASAFAPAEHRLFTDLPWVRAFSRSRLSLGMLGGMRTERLRVIEHRRAVRRLGQLLQAQPHAACIAMDVFSAELLAAAAAPEAVTLFQFHNSFAAIAGTRGETRIRRLASRLDAMVALTRDDADAFERAGMGHWRNMPNPLPYEPAPAQEEMREKLVVAMGRFTEQKALHVLLEAWAIANAAEPDWRLEIFGNGPLEKALRARARQLGLQNASILPPTDAVPEVFSRASIYALPSRYEGLPMVLIEALAFGVPAVVTDCAPGVRQLVPEAGAGLSSPVGDAHAFAANLLRLMREPIVRKQMAGAGRQGAIPYRLSQVTAKWRDLISDIRKGREPAGRALRSGRGGT